MAKRTKAEPQRDRASELKRRVNLATFSSLLLPGLGHLRLGRKITGLAMIVGTLLAVALSAIHLYLGLSMFESTTGSFLFGVLLRALVILYGYALVDSYYGALFIDDHHGVRRRMAAALNLLVPGAGYLVAKAWIRAGTGVLVLAMIIVFAGLRYHRFLDLIYIGMQLVMMAAVYQHFRIAQAKAGVEAPHANDPVGPSQITVFFVIPALLVAMGYVVHLRMPSYDLARVDREEIQIRPSSRGIAVKVPRLELDFSAWGDGWIAKEYQAGAIFNARHDKNVTLRVGTQIVLPFVQPHRYVEHLRQKMVEGGYTHQKTKRLKLHGRRVYQLRFSRSIGVNQYVDQWTIVAVRAQYAYLMLLECNRMVCKTLVDDLEKTRNSLKLGTLEP